MVRLREDESTSALDVVVDSLDDLQFSHGSPISIGVLYRPGALVFARSPKGFRSVTGCTVPFTFEDPQVPRKNQLVSISDGTPLLVMRQGCILLGESSAQYEVMLPEATLVWVWASCVASL